MYPDPAVSSTETIALNTPMNPEVKVQWLEALRSDKYKQGKGKLRKIASHLFRAGRKTSNDGKNDRYCCFGVLCELYRENTGKGKWVFDSFYGEYRFYDGTMGRWGDPNGNNAMPTDAVYKWAGLQHYDAIRLDEKDAKRFPDDSGYPKVSFYLAEANDGGRTFKTIANVIEKYL